VEGEESDMGAPHIALNLAPLSEPRREDMFDGDILL